MIDVGQHVLLTVLPPTPFLFSPSLGRLQLRFCFSIAPVSRAWHRTVEPQAASANYFSNNSDFAWLINQGRGSVILLANPHLACGPRTTFVLNLPPMNEASYCSLSSWDRKYRVFVLVALFIRLRSNSTAG